MNKEKKKDKAFKEAIKLGNEAIRVGPNSTRVESS